MVIKFLTMAVLGLLCTGAAFAGSVSVPEIDPGSVAVPFALVGGAILIVRSRIRR